jgi:hypothetical protein
MTPLILDLWVSGLGTHSRPSSIFYECGFLSPHLPACTMTFLTVGIFRVGHDRQLRYSQRPTESLSSVQRVFHYAVTLTRFR